MLKFSAMRYTDESHCYFCAVFLDRLSCFITHTIVSVFLRNVFYLLIAHSENYLRMINHVQKKSKKNVPLAQWLRLQVKGKVYIVHSSEGFTSLHSLEHRICHPLVTSDRWPHGTENLNSILVLTLNFANVIYFHFSLKLYGIRWLVKYITQFSILAFLRSKQRFYS